MCVKPEEICETSAREFEFRAKSFVHAFTALYPTKHVTPYMHCMIQHVSEFMLLHGSLVPFTQQELENYNDVMTKDYFRSTCHRGEQCLIQIMQKQNRLEYLRAIGAKCQKKYQVTCSNCLLQGHNRLTCTKPCSHAVQ